MMEGLAYRIVPFRTDSSTRIDCDKLYRNCMTSFRFGGIEEHDIYLDDVNRSALRTLRYSFVLLADALLRQDRSDELVAVVDKYFAVFEKSQPDETSVSLHEFMMKAREHTDSIHSKNQ